MQESLFYLHLGMHSAICSPVISKSFCSNAKGFLAYFDADLPAFGASPLQDIKKPVCHRQTGILVISDQSLM